MCGGRASLPMQVGTASSFRSEARELMPSEIHVLGACPCEGGSHRLHQGHAHSDVRLLVVQAAVDDEYGGRRSLARKDRRDRRRQVRPRNSELGDRDATSSNAGHREGDQVASVTLHAGYLRCAMPPLGSRRRWGFLCIGISVTALDSRSIHYTRRWTVRAIGASVALPGGSETPMGASVPPQGGADTTFGGTRSARFLCSRRVDGGFRCGSQL